MANSAFFVLAHSSIRSRVAGKGSPLDMAGASSEYAVVIHTSSDVGTKGDRKVMYRHPVSSSHTCQWSSCGNATLECPSRPKTARDLGFRFVLGRVGTAGPPLVTFPAVLVVHFSGALLIARADPELSYICRWSQTALNVVAFHL